MNLIQEHFGLSWLVDYNLEDYIMENGEVEYRLEFWWNKIKVITISMKSWK
jgi:hypothetical protein